MPEEMRMCYYTDLPKTISLQRIFNGSNCKKCYYENYNTLINAQNETYKHHEFV